MRVLYNDCVLLTLPYVSPMCAGPLILRKWAFEQWAGRLDPQIEPPHCASYKVAQLEPVLLAKFMNDRSSLRPSSCLQGLRYSEDPPRPLPPLSSVCSTSPAYNHGSSPSPSAPTYGRRAWFPTGKRVTVLRSSFCRILVGELGSYSTVRSLPSCAEVQIGLRSCVG